VKVTAKNHDFSPRWHLIAVASVAAALLLLYFGAKKIIFG
jgi:hypothetical protein